MRKHLKKTFGSALAVGAITSTLMLTGNARADVFDTTLASPNTNAATGSPNSGVNNGTNPSWYNGTGNPQGGWTVGTGNGIEVGLRAKYRNADSAIDSPTDDYSVSAGECILNPTCKGSSSNANLALWNYEFSIDLRPNGVGTLTLADIAANTTLKVTDVTTGATATIDPLTYWMDDSGFGSGGAGGTTKGATPGSHIPPTAGDWGAQNSENLGFGDSPLAASFNPNSGDEYDFVLTVANNAGLVLATTDMEVVATPEPSAVILFGTILLGVLAMVRRRRTV